MSITCHLMPQCQAAMPARDSCAGLLSMQANPDVHSFGATLEPIHRSNGHSQGIRVDQGSDGVSERPLVHEAWRRSRHGVRAHRAIGSMPPIALMNGAPARPPASSMAPEFSSCHRPQCGAHLKSERSLRDGGAQSASASSSTLIKRGSSAVTSGEKRAMTLPSRPMTNFSKFHSTSVSEAGLTP